jgi:hypothetical protein
MAPSGTCSRDSTVDVGSLEANVRDYGTEFYAGFRTYDLDAPGGAAQLENITAVMTGARVKF